MQIDRRITNGLAWAGAALVVAIPLADFAIRQMSGPEAPQVAVVQEDAATPQPPPVAERPSAPAADPVETAATTTRPSGDGGAVDSFLQSGRELPSYISGGSNTASAPPPAATPRPATTQPSNPTTATRPPVITAPATPTQPSGASQASLGDESSASVTRTRVVTLPTPVSMRPTAMASVQPMPAAQPLPSARPIPAVSQQPPLVIDNPMPVVPDRSGGVVTAQDLDDWESGPLSEFLANRDGSGGNYAPPPRSNYDPNGFFLDQGPNNGRGEPVYDEEFYFPFAQ